MVEIRRIAVVRLLGRYKFAVLPIVVTAGLFLGGVLHWSGTGDVGNVAWLCVSAVGALYAAYTVIDGLRSGRLGVDVVALLALVGAVLVKEYLAGAVISVMLASGHALEEWAVGHATVELKSLLDRVPKSAHRVVDGQVTTVDLDEVAPGDSVLVTSGEQVPVDGTLSSPFAVIDESALTGESLPIERKIGEQVRSGVVNAGNPFEIRASATAAQSTYSGVVRLVAQAQASQAPFVRLADRYAVSFLGVSLVTAAFAWVIGGPTRAVAVLVVATPCPLILAVPVALVSGLSRSAHRGIIVKSGAVLERLAKCTTLLIDKTGTVTKGQPVLKEVITSGLMSSHQMLELGASLDQDSSHVLAGAVVRTALERGCQLQRADSVEEVAGMGIRGVVAGREISLGKASWIGMSGSPAWAKAAKRKARLDGALTVFAGVDGQPAGVFVFSDPLRADVNRTLRSLRARGIGRIVMVTGDRLEVAESVSAVIGVDQVLAERTPEEKLEVVRYETSLANTLMVGDGINDAPALALASVGIAMGARGASAASEAADVVITADRLDRLSEAVGVAQRTMRIARQSMVIGVGLSLVAMLFATLGLLAAVWGALLQELIDVSVILNALRALQGSSGDLRLSATDTALTRRFQSEHMEIRGYIEQVRAFADSLGTETPEATLVKARELYRVLNEEVAPHELAEETVLYPALAKVLGGNEPLGTMSRAHTEIAHQIRRLSQLIADIDPPGPDDVDIAEMRSLLYGLHAILALHTAQEEESYLSLGDESALV
ncbi:MAG: heavy metal translocating P-type ATPase [Acidobacteria bacterium]|nr:heavy metal translocating P-type ATPase [Acidobacteriota bacterium]